MSFVRHRYSILLLMPLWVLFGLRHAMATQPRIMELSPAYQALQQQLSSNPGRLLEHLKAVAPSRDTSDLVRAQYWLLLSQTYYQLTYPGQALEYAQRGLRLVEMRTQPWLYHQLKLNESMAFDAEGRPALGISGAKAALHWAKQQQRPALQVDALYVLGNLQISLMEYVSALKNLQAAKSLLPQPRSAVSSGQIAGAMALVYEYRHEAKLSIPFFKQAVDYHRQHQQWQELSIALYGLGRAEKNIGHVTQGQAELKESASIAGRIGDVQGVAYATKELAGIDIAQQHYDDAERRLLKARSIFQRSNNPYMLLDVASSLVELSLRQHRPVQAESYLQQARSYLNKSSMPLQSIRLDEQAAQILAGQGHYQRAFQQLLKTVRLKQQLLSEQSTKQLHQMRSNYELQVQQQRNTLLEQKNQLQEVTLTQQRQRNHQLWIMFILAMVICSLLVLLVRRSRQSRQKLMKLANFDSLTGLYNRRKTLEMLNQQFDLTVRHKLELCVVVVDLDFFKKINDEYGHSQGDEVLSRFGQLCQETFRHTDIIGRIGGEEFLMALPMTGLQNAEQMVTSLRLKVAELRFSVPELRLTVSCGISVYQQQEKALDMISEADRALYRAKNAGRNRIEIGTPAAVM